MQEAQHLSQAENIIIQLGISALVVLVLGYVGYKIAVLLINKWAHGDAKRTEEFSNGFRLMAASHERVMQQVNENHQHVLSVINAHQADELETMQTFRVELNRLDVKISTAMELTPPPIMIDSANEATPVDRPPVKIPPKPPRAQTGPIAYPTQYIQLKPKKG